MTYEGWLEKFLQIYVAPHEREAARLSLMAVFVLLSDALAHAEVLRKALAWRPGAPLLAAQEVSPSDIVEGIRRDQRGKE